MPVNGPTSVTGEYNPSVASPQAKTPQSLSESFLGANRGISKTDDTGTWINPTTAVRETVGFATKKDIQARQDKLTKARQLLGDIPRGPVLSTASSEPALGMPNSRHSWPVQAVKDTFDSINRINKHLFAPESPYDSMDELITDTTMLAGEFTGAGVASRIGKPVASNVLRTGIGGDTPNMESVLSNKINEITQKLEKHQGTYKERLVMMDELKELKGNLMLVIKQRETAKPELRGRKTMLNDEGIPKVEKIEGPVVKPRTPSQILGTRNFTENYAKSLEGTPVAITPRELREVTDVLQSLFRKDPYNFYTQKRGFTVDEIIDDPSIMEEFLGHDPKLIPHAHAILNKLKNEAAPPKKKYMRSDEGIPKDDKIVAPVKMYDKNMPMDRVQAEIKKIREFAKETNLQTLTNKDIAMHVYGSDEPWATKRIREALVAFDKEVAKSPDTIGVSPPPVPEKPPSADNVKPLLRGANDNSVIKSESMGEPSAEDVLRQELDRDPFQEGIDELKMGIADERKAERPDLFRIKHYNDRIKELERQRDDFNTEWAKDPPPFEGQPDMSMYGTPEFDYSVQPLIDNYMGVVYTPEELPLIKARFEKAGVTNSTIFDVIDIFELDGIKGLKKLKGVLEKNIEGESDKEMLRFIKDLINKTKGIYE